LIKNTSDKKIRTTKVFGLLLILVIGAAFLRFAYDLYTPNINRNIDENMGKSVSGRIVQILSEEKVDNPFIYGEQDNEQKVLKQTLRVEIKDELYKEILQTVEYTSGATNNYLLKPGDKLILYLTFDDNGNIDSCSIQEIDRSNTIYFIVAVFFLMLIMIGGFRGFAIIGTLILTFLFIWYGFIPSIIGGESPLLSSAVACLIISIMSIPIIIGWNTKSVAVFAGTIISITFAGAFAWLAGTHGKIIGIDLEYIIILSHNPAGPKLDVQGIYFAGILIGSLGAILDTSISIASAIYELVKLNPKTSRKELFKSGMRIGKDTIGMMSSTLILAYVGSSIPLFVLMSMYKSSMFEVMITDMVASEIIRSIAGSLGLGLAIPITALVGSIVMQKKNVLEEESTLQINDI
jgi:uncharacterized membrane protein